MLQKLKISLYLGLFFGIVGSLAYVAYWVQIEAYATYELQRFWLYFVRQQMNLFVLWLVIPSVLFAAVWMFWGEAEGLLLSSVPVLLVGAPIVFYVNRWHLPGITEPASIIGNAVMGLLALGLTLAAFFMWTRKVKLLHKLYTPAVFAVMLVILAGVNLGYLAQPAHARLEPAPKTVNEDFYHLFDFSSDGLSDLTLERVRTDPEAAREAILAYFANRTASVRQQVCERIDRLYPDTSYVISWADDILQRKFTLWDVTKQLPETIDWYDNPTGDKVWIFALNEFEWLWSLVAAYVMTGDEKYARDFARLMRNFFDQVSMIPWKNEQDPVWRLIGTGLRMSDSWVEAFYVFLPSESVSDELKIELLGHIHDHAQFLYHFRSPRWNHLIQEAYGLMKVATLIPEFKMSGAWLDMSVYRLDRATTWDIYPDGGYTEASTFYHRYVVRLFDAITRFAKEHGVELTENFYDRFEKMYDFMLYTARPDGRLPQVNDGFHSRSLRKLFKRPAEQFNRPDFEFFATAGAAGRPPEQTSKAFPYTGLYCMRSDWTENARYLLFDGGLFGSAHGHEDKLSFEVFAYGSPFIVEAGTYTYVYNRWHRYFESSFAHNTIIVDGKSQLRQPYKDAWATEPHQELPNTWMSTEHFDYVESTYDDGYGNLKEEVTRDVTHIRRILFVKPDYWILWDVLEGRGEHTFEQRFHFVPLELTFLENKATLTQNSDAANVLLYPLEADELSVDKIIGSEEPIGGWYSPKYGVKMAAPTVIYTKQAQVPTAFVQVLFPLRPGQSAEGVQVRALPCLVDGNRVPAHEALAMQVTHSGGTDTILLAPSLRGTRALGNFETDEELFIHRRGKDGPATVVEHTLR